MKRRFAHARRPPASKRWLLWAFFLCAGPVGLAAAWATPAMQVPDEATHTARAAGLLHGAVLATRRWAPDPAMGDYGWEAGVRSSVPLENVALSSTSHGPLSGTTTLKPLRLRRLFFYDLPNTAMYFPAAYVPAAAGIGLVAALHGSAPAAFVAGRLGSLIAFLALGAAALSVAAYGEAVLLCVLLLPLVLLLAGSINQDGVLMAGTCFAVAALTRREAGWRLAGLAGLALLAAAKPPYAPLMGLYLMAPQAAGWRSLAVALIAAGALVAGWVVLTAATVMVPFHYMAPDTDLYGFYHPGPLYTGDRAAWFFLMDPGAQIADLRAHPLAIFSVVARTVMVVPPHLFGEWLGRFGRLPLPVGLWLGVPWALAAGAALLANRPSGRPAAMLAWLLLLGSFWAVMLSLYVDNTPVGALSLTGFDTRYLLPLLPCVALTLERRAWTWWGVAPVLALGLFDAVYLPVLIWRSYGG